MDRPSEISHDLHHLESKACRSFSLTVSCKVGSRYIKGVWGGRPGSPISRPTPGAAPRLRHSKPMHIRGPQFSLPSPPLRPARRDLPFATLFRSHFNPGSSPPRVLPHRQSPPTRTHAPLPLCPFRPFLVPNMCSLGCSFAGSVTCPCPPCPDGPRSQNLG